MARRSVAEVATGGIVLLAAAGFVLYAAAHTGRTGGGGYPLHAEFDSIDGISDGSDVRLAGVKVGSVTRTAVDPRTYRATVDLMVAGNVQLPRDSSAQITTEGLLGGKYVSLMPGGDEKMLPPGGEIVHTQPSISLEALLGKFIFGMSSSGPGTKPDKPAGAP